MQRLLILVFGLFVHLSFAQDAVTNYPNKPVRLVVTTAAGGGSDAIARPLEQKFLNS